MKNRNSREQLTKEAEANVIKARKDAEMWREIKDKIAKSSFVALLLIVLGVLQLLFVFCDWIESEWMR